MKVIVLVITLFAGLGLTNESPDQPADYCPPPVVSIVTPQLKSAIIFNAMLTLYVNVRPACAVQTARLM